MLKNTNSDNAEMAFTEQLDELANTLETLKAAAYERVADLTEKKAEYPQVDGRKIDSLPGCFTHLCYGEMAIQILEGISQPDEGRAVTEREAYDLESALSDARNWLDQAGVPTEQILPLPLRRRTPRPVQFKQIGKAIKDAASIAAEALSMSNTSDEGLEQRLGSLEVLA